MAKITEEQVLEAEQAYQKNRKEIILKGFKTAKLSDTLHKLAVSNIGVFCTASLINYAYILDKIQLGSVPAQILAIVFGGSCFAALGLEAASKFAEIEVDATIEEVTANDTVIRYKRELNDRYVKNIVPILNPELARKLGRIKLNNPINILTFKKLDKDEQELLIEEAKFSRKQDGIEYIDFIEDENREILEEAKRRKFIKRF